jgi:hypothetical protein
MRYKLPFKILSRTFDHFRGCGRGKHECQALWTSAWQAPQAITDTIHPSHIADEDHFVVDSGWLNTFWIHLAETEKGIRAQIHTHQKRAFHSPSDDAFPIIHTPGFLSLVIPNFATGPVGFGGAYLAEIATDGSWREVRCEDHFEII